MCVGGKGVTQTGRQRLSLDTADNEEVVELPTNRFQLLWLSSVLLPLLVPATYVPELNSGLLVLHLALNQGDTLTLLTPSTITTLALVLLPKKPANSIVRTAVHLASNSLQPDSAKYLLYSVLVVIFRYFRVLPEVLYNLNSSVAL